MADVVTLQTAVLKHRKMKEMTLDDRHICKQSAAALPHAESHRPRSVLRMMISCTLAQMTSTCRESVAVVSYVYTSRSGCVDRLRNFCLKKATASLYEPGLPVKSGKWGAICCFGSLICTHQPGKIR